MQVGRRPRPKNEAYRRQFGQHLRSLRNEHGLSQEQLSHDTGIARRYLSGIERGEANPTIDLLAALAEALDVQPADLMPPVGRPRVAKRS